MSRRFAVLRAVAGAELRSGRRSLTALALIAGVTGGLVLAAGVLADRTGSAYPRLVEAVHLDDARVLVAADQPGLADEVAHLPGVEQSRTGFTWVGQLDGPALRFVSIGAGPDRAGDVVRPVAVAGRAPARDAPGELMIGEPLAQSSGLGVGDEVTVSLLTLAEVSQFDVGFGAPDGATVTLRVVGIARMPGWGYPMPNALASPAFAAIHGEDAAARGVFLSLADGVDERAFADAFLAAADGANEQRPSVLAQYVPPTVDFPRADVDPAIRAAERVLTGGLAVFALVLAGGGLLVVGQGLLRHHGGRRPDQDVQAALGMTGVERASARMLAAVPVAAVAAALAAGVALAAGLLDPLGSQARFEPAAGFRPVWSYVVGGGLGTGLVLLALVGATAAVAGAPSRRTLPRPRPVALCWPRRPALLVGIRLALHGRSARSGPPATVTLVGATLAVAGIVAALAFGASLARLVESPARYGLAADLSLVDAREDDVERLVADERVTALDVMSIGQARIVDDPRGGETEMHAYQARKGDPPVETVTGRAPVVPGEVALGPRVAQRLQVTTGDVVEIARPGGGSERLRVTGVVVLLPENRSGLGDAVLVNIVQAARLSVAEPVLSARIFTAPGQAEPLFGELSANLELFPRETPDEIRNLDDVVMLPEILAAVLALVAGAGLAHALLTNARRHARAMAVLSVLGATPGQVRRTFSVMALATVLPALLVGVPLGLAVARVLWWEVATSTGVGGDVVLPGRLLLVLAPAVLLAALALAAVPTVRASRARPAAALRHG